MTAQNLAAEYAESVGRGYWVAYENGAVFGWQECAECGAYADDECEHDREPASAYDFLSDALDIDYVVSSSGEYRGAEVLVSFGGPNAWIDTRSRMFHVAWGERASWAIPGEMAGELDDALEELWATR